MTVRFVSSVSLVLVVVSRSLFGQQLTLRDIRAAYKSFEYPAVIRLADTLLGRTDSLATSDLIEVHLLKAIAHFSLGNEEDARQSIVSVLVLQPDYTPDASTISPKIIRFFEKTRSEYFQSEERKRQMQLTSGSTITVHPTGDADDDLARGAMLRSFLFPGWGHAYISDNPKSWILLSVSVVSLGSMTYYIVRTAAREQDYLKETRPQLIEEKYDRYNASYRLRNALIITYAVLWLYSQVDLLFLSDQAFTHRQRMGLVPVISPNHAYGVTLSFALDFFH